MSLRRCEAWVSMCHRSTRCRRRESYPTCGFPLGMTSQWRHRDRSPRQTNLRSREEMKLDSTHNSELTDPHECTRTPAGSDILSICRHVVMSIQLLLEKISSVPSSA